MICVNQDCDSEDIKVVDSRPHDGMNWIRRRRLCNGCGYRWNTIEMAEFELDAIRACNDD